jgi:predicted aldo/keto reductase-like oxidoreductase
MMRYRKLGRTGIEVSEIGMGLEHLLVKDEQTVIDTIKAAVDGGVTYLDCHPGHDYDNRPDPGIYEGYIKLGKALKGVRDKLTLTYIASCRERELSLARTCFEGYLRALGTDHTDVFIIQFCDTTAEYEQVTSDTGLLAYARQLRAEGKVRFIGISTHSSDIAYKAINSGAFDVLMYPVNPAFDVVIDEDMYKTDNLATLWDAAYAFSSEGKRDAQPRKNVYIECERRGVGLVAMKPFAGGFIFRVEQDAGFTPVKLISYVLAQNGLSTVVPGCTQPREIEEILTYYTCSDEDRDYSDAVARSRWSVAENCLYCNHCLPCSVDINVGYINRLLDAISYDPSSEADSVHEKYRALAVKASACTQCGVCVERCPFDVNVIERMQRAAEVFEN